MRNHFGIRAGIAAIVLLAPLVLPAQEHFNLTTDVHYSGRAFALEMTEVRKGGSKNTEVLSDSGVAPTGGGEVQGLLADAGPVTNVTAQTLTAETIGAGGVNRSHASMTHFDATIGPHHITALWIESKARASVADNTIKTGGKSTIEGLMVDGKPTSLTGAPNQTIALPDGHLILNEQSGTKTEHFGSITVNAIHLVATNGASLIAASSKAEVALRAAE